jgi:hypothetical protein
MKHALYKDIRAARQDFDEQLQTVKLELGDVRSYRLTTINIQLVGQHNDPMLKAEVFERMLTQTIDTLTGGFYEDDGKNMSVVVHFTPRTINRTAEDARLAADGVVLCRHLYLQRRGAAIQPEILLFVQYVPANSTSNDVIRAYKYE